MSMLRLLAAVLVAFSLTATAAWAQQRPAAPAQAPASRDLSIRAFFGTFTGTGLARTEDSAYFGVTVRDLDVKIEALPGDGFQTKWTSVIRSGGDPARPRVRRREAVMQFMPVPGKADLKLYRSTESGDPLDGKLMAWARITRNTLLMHMVQINEDGSYDFETYSRTLSASGMELVYSRVRDGEQYRSVKGKLIKNAN
jgi:hypothetical protein